MKDQKKQSRLIAAVLYLLLVGNELFIFSRTHNYTALVWAASGVLIALGCYKENLTLMGTGFAALGIEVMAFWGARVITGLAQRMPLQAIYDILSHTVPSILMCIWIMTRKNSLFWGLLSSCFALFGSFFYFRHIAITYVNSYVPSLSFFINLGVFIFGSFLIGYGFQDMKSVVTEAQHPDAEQRL